MDLIEINEKLMNSILNDQEIIDWCEDNYSKTPLLLIGYDPEDPPGRKESPCIAMVPVVKKIDLQDTHKRATFAFLCNVYNNSKITGENYVKYIGEQHAEEFRQLTQSAIVRAIDEVKLLQVDQLEIDYDSMNEPPNYGIVMGVSLREKQYNNRTNLYE